MDSLRGAADYLGHLVSQVDATRDRLILLFDQLSAREQHRMGKAMQKLAVVGTVFLPLTFVTGLLGINVAGIPDAHDPMACWLVCLFLVAIVVAAIMIIKWKKFTDVMPFPCGWQCSPNFRLRSGGFENSNPSLRSNVVQPICSGRRPAQKDVRGDQRDCR